MKQLKATLHATGILFLGGILSLETLALANRIEDHRVSSAELRSLAKLSRRPAESWAFAFDNDVLVPGSRDQDYTYGLNLTFTGASAQDHWLSLHSPLSWLDSKTGLGKQTNALSSQQIEYGLFGFTPEDITLPKPTDGDRPYASLLYVSSTTEYYLPHKDVAWQSSLTLGVLGLDLVGELQKAVHDLTDGDQPQGWDTQISADGEPTLRYSIARQALLSRQGNRSEFKHTWQASIGYLTEFSWSLSTRLGKLHTPWTSFNPELTAYGEKSAPNVTTHIHEHYAWGGLAIKARAYNAFLQGQFRNSEISYNADELNHGIAEAWLGYTLALTNGYRFTYALRGHTSELKEGPGDRDVVWGGIQLARAFR